MEKLTHAEAVVGARFRREPDPEDSRFNILTIRVPQPIHLPSAVFSEDRGAMASRRLFLWAVSTLLGAGLIPENVGALIRGRIEGAFADVEEHAP